MQKFTRALTREIEVGGERLAVTLSEEGLAVRPVGSRRPPLNMSWSTWLHLCVEHSAAAPPTDDQLQQSIKTLRKGGARTGAAGAEKKHGPTSTEEAPPAAPASKEQATAPPSTSLPMLLGRLDQWLRKHRHRFQEALLPGATPADCDHLASALGIRMPEELRAWLSWHNGQNDEVPGALEESWMIMSTDEIIADKKELDQPDHKGWQKSWIPFLKDGSGNYLCVDISQPNLPVIECWQDQQDHRRAAPSLTAWVEDFVNAVEKGEYSEDPERGRFLRRERSS